MKAMLFALTPLIFSLLSFPGKAQIQPFDLDYRRSFALEEEASCEQTLIQAERLIESLKEQKFTFLQGRCTPRGSKLWLELLYRAPLWKSHKLFEQSFKNRLLCEEERLRQRSLFQEQGLPLLDTYCQEQSTRTLLKTSYFPLSDSTLRSIQSSQPHASERECEEASQATLALWEKVGVRALRRQCYTYATPNRPQRYFFYVHFFVDLSYTIDTLDHAVGACDLDPELETRFADNGIPMLSHHCYFDQEEQTYRELIFYRDFNLSFLRQSEGLRSPSFVQCHRDLQELVAKATLPVVYSTCVKLRDEFIPRYWVRWRELPKSDPSSSISEGE